MLYSLHSASGGGHPSCRWRHSERARLYHVLHLRDLSKNITPRGAHHPKSMGLAFAAAALLRQVALSQADGTSRDRPLVLALVASRSRSRVRASERKPLPSAVRSVREQHGISRRTGGQRSRSLNRLMSWRQPADVVRSSTARTAGNRCFSAPFIEREEYGLLRTRP